MTTHPQAGRASGQSPFFFRPLRQAPRLVARRAATTPRSAARTAPRSARPSSQQAIDLTREILQRARRLPHRHRAGLRHRRRRDGAVVAARRARRRHARLGKLRRGLGHRRRQAAEARRRRAPSRPPTASCRTSPSSIFDRDVVFTWNGTTSGVRVPNADLIPADRQGLTICDATSAAFAQRLDFDKLDVVTFSWQKVLGGEAAHGMLILSPRAVERLESYTPAWPLPKIFRMTKGGKLIEGIFKGETINTPSMLCVEDYLDALNWAKSIGGLDALIARADANVAVIEDFVDKAAWIGQPRRRSGDALEHLGLPDDRRSRVRRARRRRPGGLRQGAWSSALEKEGVAYDIGAYRDAPPGLRIWSGATVETVRSRGADALARLGLRQPEGGAQGCGLTHFTGVHAARLIRPRSARPFSDSGEEQAPPFSPCGRRCRRRRRMRGRHDKEHPMPRVLVSDKLSPTAVQIFKDRGIDVDYQPDLGKDKEKLAEIIGQYDGLAIRSATKVTEKLIAAADQPQGRSAAPASASTMSTSRPRREGHHRDEHALRQLDHHRRTRHRDDVRRRPPNPRGERLDPGRQVGEEPLHGRRDHRQDAGRDRLRQYRLDRRDARHRPEDEGRRLRSLPVGGARRRNWASRRWSSTSCSPAPTSSRCTRR